MALPDACGDKLHKEKLIAAQQKDNRRNIAQSFVEREKYLITAAIVFVFLMNFETGCYVLYPFELFMTWVHKMLYGTASINSQFFFFKTCRH